MKLLIVAAVVAVSSAARLEGLQRSYLPPGNTNFGTNGFGTNSGSFGNGFNAGNNGLGNGLKPGNGVTNGFGSNGHGSNGVGPNGQKYTNGFGTNGNGHSASSNGNGGSQGTNGFGSNGNNGFIEATSNQYLPPNQVSAGNGAGFNFGGSSFKPACSNCPSRYTQQYNPAASIPGTSYGVPQFGANFGTNGGSPSGAPDSGNHAFGTLEPSDASSGPTFGPSNGNLGSPGFAGSQVPSGSQGAANRQYLPPRPSAQNPPQQPFDAIYGYLY